jgi:hypothetical protein
LGTLHLEAIIEKEIEHAHNDVEQNASTMDFQ